MTMFEPTLIVSQLRIEKSGKAAYHEKFHSGVNILRGENSSGKSTVLNLLLYGLGADITEWSAEALLCEFVYVETCLNGVQVTLRREIEKAGRQPMSIFFGGLDQGLGASHGEWWRFPYNRGDKLSFSQELFQMLGIPEAANDSSGRITLHQVLRLLYSDQLSPADTIFRRERSFDSPAIREAVGRLLCGTHETDIYHRQLLIREREREYDKLDASISSLYSILGGVESLSVDWCTQRIRGTEEEIKDLLVRLKELDEEKHDTASRIEPADVSGLVNRIKGLRASYFETRKLRDSLNMQVSEVDRFSTSLAEKIIALRESEVMGAAIGQVAFTTCPSCMTMLEDETPEHQCHLCKQELTEASVERPIALLAAEYRLDFERAKASIERLQGRLEEANGAVESADRLLDAATKELLLVRGRVTSEWDRLKSECERSLGYLSRRLEDERRQLALVEKIESLSERGKYLLTSIAELRGLNEAEERRQEERLRKAYSTIEEEVKLFLKSDLHRQGEFYDPKAVYFDFGGNRITVDGADYFSASSRVILRNSFYLGFAFAATRAEFFRHPRFCVVDTIEDKGMERERSWNFQQLVVERSKVANVEHQIIFATAMISPALEGTEYTVGRFTTERDKSLRFS